PAPADNSGKSSLNRCNAHLDGVGGEPVSVRVRPLDAFLDEAGASRVDLIKIDVEGAEMMVLRGAKQTLQRHRPAIIIELIEELLESMGTSSDEVSRFLAELGYARIRDFGDNAEFRHAGGAPSA